MLCKHLATHLYWPHKNADYAVVRESMQYNKEYSLLALSKPTYRYNITYGGF